jgi:alkylhydroperoxidase/carboxymuconolactone decarboxylase family protein YurZ
MEPLPESKLPPAEIDRLKKAYTDLLGFVPPRFTARADLMSRLDPEGLIVQEEMRRHFMNPKCFDAKTSQLILFGILLVNLQDAAKIHAVAARRAGATWEELTAVMGLAFLFRGLSAVNVGSHMLQDVAAAEQAAAATR